jgi:lipopolysaccharide export system ATP-binding protein
MSSLRLLVYYSKGVVFYALVASAIMLFLASIIPPHPIFGTQLKHPPWFFLILLATLGIPSGIIWHRYLHVSERYHYSNHGLSGLQCGSFAALLVWLISIAAAMGLHAWQNNDWLSRQLRFEGSVLESLLSSAIQSSQTWLKAHPQVVIVATVFLLILGLAAVINWLSDSAEGFEDSEKPGWELSVDSAVHSFGPCNVLKGAWLKCRSGEILGLLGRNGCGKSTLLQILFGTLKGDFRALLLNGHPLKKLYLLGLCAYLPQATFLPRGLTVKQVILLFAGQPREGLLAEEPRIKELGPKRIHELSGGELRFLELGLVLALKRPILLFDEPFSELEPIYKQRARKWIQLAAEQGSAVILTDHDYAQIIQLSHRLMLMHHGQTEEVHDLKALNKIYLPD